MRRGRRGEPTDLSALIPRVLGDLGMQESLRIASIASRWEEAVGSEIARHCQPSSLRGDVLAATVDSSVWSQQLQLRQPEILAALRRVMGEQAPTGLRFRVGYNLGR